MFGNVALPILDDIDLSTNCPW